MRVPTSCAAGDRPRAEAWFKKYGVMPPELKTALQGAKDVPVDIDPVFMFPELPSAPRTLLRRR